MFKSGIPDKCKVGLNDLVHAVISAIAFADHRVTNCLFPGHEKGMDQAVESLPLMAETVLFHSSHKWS
ncbi:hypothetical protein Dsin_024520 [Dipteronia sinensis]|uniref:Uncharacterized protein n=1 Tax=Dipteronia sinensis TaxID=43782 RepID=A0AAD9ZU58_9ROSI|nr:hypothetical protein Dsin_024520 [Dipteronia sinensis]